MIALSGCKCACGTSQSWELKRTRLYDAYSRLFWWWFAFGFPAFGAVLLIFWLMIARPAIPYWD
jgi:uncharacterized membrane protein